MNSDKIYQVECKIRQVERLHKAYMDAGNKTKTRVERGVTFYPVGRNSTHLFFLGIKGEFVDCEYKCKLLRMSVYEESEENREGLMSWYCDWRIDEIPPPNHPECDAYVGYIGHH